MDINQQAYISGLIQQLEKRSASKWRIDPENFSASQKFLSSLPIFPSILAGINALQAKEGQKWRGASIGALKGTVVPAGALAGAGIGGGLTGMLGKAITELISEDEKTREMGEMLGYIPGALAGAGLGLYGGNKLVDELVGPQFYKEVFGKGEEKKDEKAIPRR